jgi:hypothetical protein
LSALSSENFYNKDKMKKSLKYMYESCPDFKNFLKNYKTFCYFKNNYKKFSDIYPDYVKVFILNFVFFFFLFKKIIKKTFIINNNDFKSMLNYMNYCDNLSENDKNNENIKNYCKKLQNRIKNEFKIIYQSSKINHTNLEQIKEFFRDWKTKDEKPAGTKRGIISRIF